MCSLYLGDQIISGQATLVGESRNIGQIIPSAIPLTDAGLHLLDGSLILGSGIYSAFVDYIAGLDLTANYFCTEQEWQTTVTTYGVCGKFVYDSVANTVRLPKYNSKIYTGDGTAPVVGNGIALGVTDGTNNTGVYSYYVNYATLYGSTGTYGANVGSTPPVGTYLLNQKAIGLTNDGDKSGVIANLANITTSLDGYYYIVVATSTKTDIQVDIDEIATDLNGKVNTADLAEVQCVVETYVNGKSGYRIYSDGYCVQWGDFGGVFSSWTTKTVTFLKPFKDINYTVFPTMGYTSNSNFPAVSAKTTTTFTCSTYDSTGTACWQASGYIEV